MDVVAFLGDIAHLFSFAVIIFRVEYAQSCVGFSLKMQVLLFIAYMSRYWDLIYFTSTYTSLLRLLTIFLSVYVIYMIFIKYKKTYEKRCDSFWIEAIILTNIPIAFCLQIDSTPAPEFISRQYSRFIESLAIIPQIYFYVLKQQKDDSVTYYVMALAFYRGFFLIKWFTDYFSGGDFDRFKIYPGIIQMLWYFIYFLLPKGKKEELPVFRNVPPKFLTQHSLLETPLLKRTATASSSIYIIGREDSFSSLERSISVDSQLTSSTNCTERY